MATRSVSSNRGHRAGQCAPEVPRTRIRARGDLLEQCPGQQQTSFGGEKYYGLASNLAHLGRIRLSSGLGGSCKMANDASSGVGNSSAQTVDAHVPREWEEPASEALREGWSEAEVCAEEVAAPREPMRGRFSAEAAPASSRSSYRQGRRKAPSGSSSKCKARHLRDEQPTEPAASGRALFVK